MNTELNLLTDEQLDGVAGGCGHHRGKRDSDKSGKGWSGMPWAMASFPDIDVQLNITVIAGNTIEAGGPVTISVDGANAAS